MYIIYEEVRVRPYTQKGYKGAMVQRWKVEVLGRTEGYSGVFDDYDFQHFNDAYNFAKGLSEEHDFILTIEKGHFAPVTDRAA